MQAALDYKAHEMLKI